MNESNTNKKPAVTVIIPVYNVENYLGECLDSVLAQTETDIEIICVNDGSTDGSRAILEDYSQRDARIRIVDKENGGLSSARNAGLDEANGKYIYYLDSDDMIVPDMIQTCKGLCDQEELDALFFDANALYENEGMRASNPHYEYFYIRNGLRSSVSKGTELFNSMVQINGYRANVGVQFARRLFLAENGFRFIEGVLYEDEAYTLRLILLADRVMHTDKRLFIRRIRANSIVTSKISAKQILCRFRNVKQILDIAGQFDLEQEAFESVMTYLGKIQMTLANSYDNAPEEQRDTAIKMLGRHEAMELVLYVKLAVAERSRKRKAIQDLESANKKLKEKAEELQSSYEELSLAYNDISSKYYEISSLKRHIKQYIKKKKPGAGE